MWVERKSWIGCLADTELNIVSRDFLMENPKLPDISVSAAFMGKLFVFTHSPLQNRYALLLDML